MKFRLRQRIAALAVLCLVPVVTVSSVALVRLAARYLVDEAEVDAARLAGTAVQATRLAMMSGDSALVARLLGALARQEDVRFLRLYDADGILKAPAGEKARRLDLASRQCTACHPDPRLAPLPPGECAHWSGSDFYLHYPVRNEPACGACHPPPEAQPLLGVVEVGLDATKIHARVGKLWRRAALWGAVVLAAAALPLLFGLGWAVERPMGECLRMVREVSHNNLAVRSPVRRTDEWGELLDSLNSMVAALQGARVTLEALNRDLEGQVIQRTRELEDALGRARESDRMKTEFLANLSHEFSTPLQGVIGYAQLLLDGIDGAITEDQRFDLEAILRNGRRLLEWSEDLLELARLEANRRYLCVDRVHVRDLVQEVVESARGQIGHKPVEVETAVADGCPDAWGDVAALRRALLHVVDNAVRHAGSGTVSVSARGDGAGGLEIRVTDTGPGMAPAVVEAALRGFGSKGGGGGLAVGLSMSRRLVEIHGGTFTVQSRVGVGTEVTLRLPGAPAVAAERR